jgi:hypothetical protein
MAQETFEVLGKGSLDGFSRVQRRTNPVREAAVNSAVLLLSSVLKGEAPDWYLKEAVLPSSEQAARMIESRFPNLFKFQESMTTSDLPYLLGGVLDRMMLANYREFPSSWRSFVSIRPGGLRDFRGVESLYVSGAEEAWNDVPEGAEFNYTNMAEGKYSYSAKKYGKGFKFSFEAWMNDNFGALLSIPQRLGRGGARTIAKFVTGLYVSSTGPKNTIYTSGNGNIVTSNPTLSVAGLTTALGQMAKFKDPDGTPIVIENLILVIPPALEVVANNLMNTLTVELVEKGGTSNQKVIVNNWVIKKFTVVVDPYIPIIDTTHGDTSWYLFASPSSGRPAIEMGFVRGFEEPVMYQKLSSSARIGGSVDQDAGDWATMSQEYKGIVAFGGAAMDPLATMASNGSGS